MGLLDDAIREHLDLKRRHGADPAEIERAEREALGPVRRRFDDPGDLPEPSSSAESIPGEDVDEDWHEPLPDAPAAGRPISGRGEYDELDSATAPAQWEHEEPFPEAEPAAPPPAAASPRSPVHGLETETSEYDVADKDDPDAEDVLEETPDFLQDTPDHDRLWFEQRPPRDFDFDG